MSPPTAAAQQVTARYCRVRLDWELAVRGYRRYAAYPAARGGLLTNSVFGALSRRPRPAHDVRRPRGHRRLRRGRRAHVRLARAGDDRRGGVFGWIDLAERIEAATSPPTSSRPVHPLRAGSRSTTVGRCTTSSSAVCRRSSSARSSSTSTRRLRPSGGRVLLAASCLRLPSSFAFRFLYNLARVLASRLPRRHADRGHRLALPLGLTSRSLLPRLARTIAYATPFPAGAAADRRVRRQPEGIELVGTLAVQVGMGGRPALAGRVALLRRDAKAGGAGWLSPPRSTPARLGSRPRPMAVPDVVCARRRRASSSFAFLDFLAILVIFHNVPQLGGWTCGGAGPGRHPRLAFAAHRPRGRQLDLLPSSSATECSTSC